MHPRRDTLSEADRARAADVLATHQQFMENVARRHAPSPDHVPDIVQAACIQVCRGLNGFRDESAVTTWLYRVTVNTARDYYKAERRHQRAVEAATATPEPERFIHPDDHVEATERMAALADALDRMKPSPRQLIRDELTGSAVLSNRKHARYRARRQLRQLLADDPRLDPET